jgi:cytoskeleton protein RodZ
VFEIGNSLREARVRQSLDFPEIEQATKIRGKYLRALEDENFEQLPGQTYVKGFLRTYADYLGLEGQLYVDEYNSRYVTGGADEEAATRFRGGGSMPRSTRLMSSAVIISLTVIFVAFALVIAAWKFGGAENRGVVDVGTETPTAKQKPHKRTQHKRTPSTATAVRLVVSATKGNSWVEVHKGSSAAGEVVYQGTLERGDHQIFTQRRLWLRVDSPRNVVVKLNGLRTALRGSAPVDLALTNRGLKTVS